MITIYKYKTERYVEHIYFNQEDGHFYIGPYRGKIYPGRFKTLEVLLDEYNIKMEDLKTRIYTNSYKN